MKGDPSRQFDGDGIAYLFCDLHVGSDENEFIGKGLQARGLTYGDGAVGLGMKISSFFRLKELRPYCG